ncbi:MAG: glycosyltransferase [Verrucomicrobia bacterium]|nr:glycosyltransferase [Verrucomicrobiota bacterium]
MTKKLTYLFTTFPVATETFLLRELRALRALGHCPEIYSMWGGKARFDGFEVKTFGWQGWIRGFIKLLKYSLTRPEVLRDWCQPLLTEAPNGPLNLGENLLGALFALSHVDEWQVSSQHRHLHAVWASAPAAAAELAARLIGTTYSFGAHAYDLFEHGGDALLERKAQGAQFVVTSSLQGQNALWQKGVSQSKVLFLRRGLCPLPTLLPLPDRRRPLQLLTVGRLVEKMGYDLMLPAFANALRCGLDSHLTIVGGGPLESFLRTEIVRLGLTDKVKLTGPLLLTKPAVIFSRAHVFLFTGKVAKSGDRAGFPNAVGEAMAFGLPVICTPVGAIPEVIKHTENGFIFNPEEFSQWLNRLQLEEDLYESVRTQARAWVEHHFDAIQNTQTLLTWFAGRTQEATEAKTSEGSG